MLVALPYGTAPYLVDLTGRKATVLEAPALPRPPALASLLEAALDVPLGATLRAAPGARVTVIVSDPTRDEPRAAFVAAVRRRLPGVRWTIAVATGTHGPCRLDALGLPDEVWRDATVVNHDGATDLVDLGMTSGATPVRVHRCVVEADLVIATGCIRPHYFAGFGAGAKAIFPGLGESAAIRINHRLKTQPGARAGVIDGNPCRADLEEAVRRLATPTFLLNGVCGPDGDVHAVVAGALEPAFRAGAEHARPWFTVRGPPAPLVLASDQLPVSATLYQAAKIAAAAAPMVAEGGMLVVVAECRDGTGPIEVVNEAIFRIGVLPRLPRGARLRLISGLPPAVVATTLIERATEIPSGDPVLVIPRASQLICEPYS